MFLAPGSPEHQQNVLYRGRRLSGVRIYSHLEHQLTNYQANAVSGAHNFSYLEERVSYCSIEQKMYVRRLLLCTEYTGAHHWYRRRASGVPNEIKDVLVQETRFWCTKWTKRCRWYRKSVSGVPTRTGHQCRASGRKLWQNSRCHS